MDGILNICKPAGMSSNRCMQIVKRKLGLKKVGFLGTLDPAASGVLVLLCGKYTKWAEYLHGRAPHPDGKTDKKACVTKVYRSVFTFGVETDTLDSAGQVVARNDNIPTFEQVKQAIPIGKIEIEIPKFSAVHINGKRAYELSRKNIDFEAPKKVVMIYRFELLKQIAKNKFWVEIECETGTYVRSLAKLVAKRLGNAEITCFAIASSILRTRVGCFDIKDAKNLGSVTINDLIQLP